MISTPAIAALTYALFNPLSGIDTIRPIQKMMLSTTAEPSPAVPSAKPASGPGTPDSVINRYPIAELAALPPGITPPSALVLIWIRNNLHDETSLLDSPSATLVSMEYAYSAASSRPSPSTSSSGLTLRSSVAALRKPGISGRTKK